MDHSTRFQLHFGPYRTPRFRYGRKAICEVRGEVIVCGITSASIAWPVGRIGSSRSLVVYGSLLRAIRRESVQAVAHHWGVSPQTVTKWRRLLGIREQPEGTSRLRRRYFAEPWADEARRKAWSKARDPRRRAKIAASRRGKPRPAKVVRDMRKRMLGTKLTEATRAKMSAAHKARGTRPPKAGRPWQRWEDVLALKLAGPDAAAQTGRTLEAVHSRRRVLRLAGDRKS